MDKQIISYKLNQITVVVMLDKQIIWYIEKTS